MPAGLTVAFSEPGCTDISVAGGKGANLARMTAAGLPVPPGFCVTTEAYAAFIAASGLDGSIAGTVEKAGADAAELEDLTLELRDEIVAAPMPDDVADAIETGYRALGADLYVAVRSSGTAEDLADASFAGLHDTYLDIRGRDELVDAVRRCWASMWTARATAYRAEKGFDQAAARISVVVQQMVESEIAGVMFTANPLTGATDEIVVNATWGLGEALVSGISTPDEHILSIADLSTKDQRVGAKQLRIVRNPDASSGTITQEVPDAERDAFALTPGQLRDLGELGRRVSTHYDGFPQDIEWAIADGELYLLQSRPVTGAELSWDSDLEFWQKHPFDDSILWTRSWADELWNGGVSPLHYSCRAPMFAQALDNNLALWGLRPMDQPLFRYHRGTAYYNTGIDRRLVTETAPKPFRVALLAHAAPDQHEEILAEPLSIWRYLWMHVRIQVHGRPVHGAFRYFRTVDDYLENRLAEANGMAPAELERLDDEALIDYMQRFVWLKAKNTEDQWSGFFIFARDSVSLLAGVLALWYDPDPQLVLTDLLSGGPERPTTAEENLWLWRLSQRIRASEELTSLFEEHGVEWTSAFQETAEGRDFLHEYGRFMTAHGHRGHADRDIYYARRSEDPSLDYETFRILLSAAQPVDPAEREREVAARREAVIADVEAKLGSQLLGGLRVKVFRGLLAYAHRFFLYRDNQRHYFDRYTFSLKRASMEIGRRLAERGRLADAGDVYFLGRSELFPLLRGEPSTPLIAAKIAGRRANFRRMLTKTSGLPKYLRGNHPVSFDTGDGDGMTGVGTSRGQVTGRARIVLSLNDIGQVEEGDILVTNSTDPGWTPVFTLLSGIVLETGGMLAHGSLLAREYGFPAVQLEDAASLIPDGALITVDGDTGVVTLDA